MKKLGLMLIAVFFATSVQAKIVYNKKVFTNTDILAMKGIMWEVYGKISEKNTTGSPVEQWQKSFAAATVWLDQNHHSKETVVLQDSKTIENNRQQLTDDEYHAQYNSSVSAAILVSEGKQDSKHGKTLVKGWIAYGKCVAAAYNVKVEQEDRVHCFEGGSCIHIGSWVSRTWRYQNSCESSKAKEKSKPKKTQKKKKIKK